MGSAASKTRSLPTAAVSRSVKQIKPSAVAAGVDVQPKDHDFLSKAISLGIVQVESKPQIINNSHHSVTSLQNRRKLEDEHDAMIGKVAATNNLRSFSNAEPEPAATTADTAANHPTSSTQKYVNTEQLTAMLQDSAELKVSEFSKKYNLEPAFVQGNLTPIFNRRIRLPTLRAELPDDWESHQTNFSVRRIRRDQEADSTDLSQTLDTTLMNMLDNGERVDHFKGQGINGPSKSDEFKRGKRLQSQVKEVRRVI